MEADMAHPVGHGVAADLAAVASIDALLAIERQAIGIFGDGDMGEQRFARHTGFDEVTRRRRLADALLALRTAIFGATGDDDAELRRRHVEPLGDVFADPDRLASAAGAGDSLRLDDDLDALQMRRERLARAARTSQLACRPCRLEFGLDRAKPGLDLVEGEGLLVGIELLGTPAEAGALQLLDDHMKIGDPLFGALVERRHPDDLGLEFRRFAPELSRLGLQFGLFRRHGDEHRLERVDVVGKGRSAIRHRPTEAYSTRFRDCFCAA